MHRKLLKIVELNHLRASGVTRSRAKLCQCNPGATKTPWTPNCNTKCLEAPPIHLH